MVIMIHVERLDESRCP